MFIKSKKVYVQPSMEIERLKDIGVITTTSVTATATVHRSKQTVFDPAWADAQTPNSNDPAPQAE